MKLAGVMWAFTHTDTLGFSYVQLCKLCHKEASSHSGELNRKLVNGLCPSVLC